jgi:TRAP-type C4-dicarboxylate transport system permease small subunit
LELKKGSLSPFSAPAYSIAESAFVEKGGSFVSVSQKSWDGLLKLVNFLIVLLLAVMTLVVTLSVFSRYVLNNAISWGEEFSRYAMIWFAMFGAMVALKDNSHVGVSVIVDLFPEKIRRGILQFGRLFVLIFLGVVFYFSIIHLIGIEGQFSPAMEIPMLVPYMSITVGAFLMFLVALRQFFGIDKVKSEGEATLDEINEGLCEPAPLEKNSKEGEPSQ